MPLMTLSAEDFGGLMGNGFRRYELEVNAWVRLMTLHVNYEYCLGGHLKSSTGVCSSGPMTKAQKCVALRFGACVIQLLELNGGSLTPEDWSETLKSASVSYEGEEAQRAEAMTLEQIRPGLPPNGVAATIDILGFCSPRVREMLLDETKLILPEAESKWEWQTPAIRAARDEWQCITEELWKLGLVRPIDETQVWRCERILVLNGAFGVVNQGKSIDVGSKKLPVLRLIMNLIPFNACQRALRLELENLPRRHMPSSWHGGMAFRWRAVLAGQSTYVCSTTVGMGWSNAVSLTQHAHRNIVRAAANISPEILRLQGCSFAATAHRYKAEGLDPKQEVLRDRPFPVTGFAGDVKLSVLYTLASPPGSAEKDVKRELKLM
eukprot:6057373-Amphidinium_carterae.5